MKDTKNVCFVCKKEFYSVKTELNPAVNLPVCSNCKGTREEKKMEEEYLDSLADGLVCGCI